VRGSMSLRQKTRVAGCYPTVVQSGSYEELELKCLSDNTRQRYVIRSSLGYKLCKEEKKTVRKVYYCGS
jgi:hypothetical protein